jgi:PAS domain-containing protein
MALKPLSLWTPRKSGYKRKFRLKADLILLTTAGRSAVETGELLEVKLDAIKQKDDELLAIASRPPPPFNPRGVANILKAVRASAANAKTAETQREQQHRREEELREAFKNVWLRATCDQLYHTLPRELCDMIYQDLLSHTGLEIYGQEQDHPDPGGIAWRLQNNDIGPDWHCYDKDALGSHVFRELIQVFFHRVYIDPRFVTLVDLPDFLLRDKWDLGVPPVGCLQDVYMDIWEADFENKTLLRNLEALRLLKRGARVSVTLLPLRRYELKEHGYEGMTMPSIPKTDFFCRTEKDMLRFFERLGPVFNILKSITEAQRVGLEVSFTKYGRYMCLHNSVPGKVVDISLEAWKQTVMEKRG